MTYWGPWQDGVEVVQTIDLITNTRTWSNDDDELLSEWKSGGVGVWSAADFHAASVGYEGGPVPPFLAAYSQQAWQNLEDETPVIVGGGAPESTSLLLHSFRSITGPSTYGLSESWFETGTASSLVFGDGGEASVGMSALPPFEEWPATATVAEVEEAEHPNDWLTLIDAIVTPPRFDFTPFKYIVKDVGDVWFDGVEPLDSLRNRQGVMAPGDAPISLNVAALNALVAEDRALGSPSDAISGSDPRWPAVATIYPNTAWPGWSGADGGGADDYTQSIDGSDGIDGAGWPLIELTYRLPRFRFGYERAPYRRITQRGDGLAGGARRIHPRPKTIQGSNRRGSGSIV